VAFVRIPGQSEEASIELVEPADTDSPVTRFLEGGGGLHHVCFEVDSIEQQLAAGRDQHVLPISQPAPAVAFDGRRICWVYTPDRLLIEYLERGR
jgi:methylmalonyl-CoA/ethylmalonyl-CoA epimerase